MKLTIEPRKTTWVKFLDSKAQLKIEWRTRATYSASNLKDAHTWSVHSRYLFSGLADGQAVPSAQLLLMEQGVPLAITQTVVSAVKDRFQSEEVEDPFVVVKDSLASLKKTNRKQLNLGKGLIERSWTENIERTIQIENKTGKRVALVLTIEDSPADELEFVNSDPAPTRRSSPEYTYDLDLAADETRSISVTLQLGCTASIRLPNTATPNVRPAPNAPVQQMVQMQRMEEVEWENESEEQT